MLWAMRVIKLERWYEEHMMCGALEETSGDVQIAMRGDILTEDGIELF